jgi:N-acetylglutamate synthase-like GNAT family acetyltransferase
MSVEAHLEVRLAEPGDEHTVERLIREAFEPFRDAYSPGGFADTTASANVIRERMMTAKIWLAFVGGEPVGTVTALPEPDRIYIRSMAVTPKAQGRGVGQKLLETLEQDARERGFEKLYLYTTFVLPGAQKLYEKNGFRVVRETAPQEWHDMGGVEMEKNLSEPGALVTGAVRE